MAGKKRNPRQPKSKHSNSGGAKPPPNNNSQPIPTGGPQFAETQESPDPTHFSVKHGSDKEAYSILDQEKGKIPPRDFPRVSGQTEPKMTLAKSLGDVGDKVVSDIQSAGQIVFHAAGDTGSIRGPTSQSEVANKMVSDYRDTDPRSIPS